MAKVNPVTTYTTKIVATNTAYTGNVITLPFKASRVSICIMASTGNEDLLFSFDGTADVARLHHTSPCDHYEFQLQEIDTLYYKLTGVASITFIVNAETKAWPNMF